MKNGRLRNCDLGSEAVVGLERVSIEDMVKWCQGRCEKFWTVPRGCLVKKKIIREIERITSLTHICPKVDH